MDKIFQYIIRYGIAIFFFVSVIWIISGNLDNLYHNGMTPDELMYKDRSDNFTINHIRDLYNLGFETKPLTFLTLEKIFNADIFYTRMFNILLIIVNTFLIFKLTKNKLSFIYIVFPLFLKSMWLTDETIELMFLLIGLCYKERNGIMVGLATIFRPYSILYSVLLSKKHILQVIIIGIIFSVILLVLGLFFPYFHEVTSYMPNNYNEIDYLAILLGIMLFIVGYKNKLMLKYSIIAAIPLLIRTNGHYFLPVYTFLFIGFLLTMNEDIK